MHSYAKELSIPRILPKLTISLDDAIKLFKGENENSINLIEIKSSYDIYFVEYESLKKKYISDSTKEKISKNLNLIKQNCD